MKIENLKTNGDSQRGYYELNELEGKGYISLLSREQLHEKPAQIILTGASPVSSTLASHEILEIVKAAEQAKGSTIRVYCLPGSESAKDLSKLLGRQGNSIDQDLVNYLFEVNRENENLENFLNYRGFSTRTNIHYKKGAYQSPAINFYSEKTPKLAILCIPSTIVACPEPDMIFDRLPASLNPANVKRIKSKAKEFLEGRRSCEIRIADITQAVSLAALDLAIETIDPKNNLKIKERIRISNHVVGDKLMMDHDLWEYTAKNLFFGSAASDAVIGFCCVDCIRQSKDFSTYPKHHFGYDGKPRNTNGGKIQNCRDGTTIAMNHVNGKGLTAEAIVKLIESNQVYVSGKATLALMGNKLNTNGGLTVLGLRDFPVSRKTYTDMVRMLKVTKENPLTASVTPTISVEINGAKQDSPIYALDVINQLKDQDIQIFRTGNNNINIEIHSNGNK